MIERDFADDMMKRPASGGGGSFFGGCLKFLGAGCLILVLLFAAGGVFLYYQGANLALKVAGGVLISLTENLFKELNLPEQERQAAMEPVRELAEKIKRREVTKEQAERLMTELQHGGFIAAVMTRVFQVRYIDASDLAAEEKASASRSAGRFARGVTTEKIGEDAMNAVVKMLEKEGPDERREIKESLTNDELRAVVAKMKEAADAAEIPDEDFKIDIAVELRRVIDVGLKQPAP